MKVLILTLGTRGDVQPFVALAAELTREGHQAVVAAPHHFTEFLSIHGVTSSPIDDGPLALMDHQKPVDQIASGGLVSKVALMRQMPALFEAVLRDCWAAATTGPGAGADVIVHNGQVVAGQHVAEALGVPAVLALPLPMYVPTRQFRWPGQEFPHWLPPGLNRLTFTGMKAPAAMFGTTVDRWRKSELGLKRRAGRHDPTQQPDGSPSPVLHAFSPQVLPRPRDWPTTAITTGYWNLEAPNPPGDNLTPSPARSGPGHTGLPDELEAFLGAGTDPIFVGFGSMSAKDPEATTDIVLAACREAGVRAVVATGWGGLVQRSSDDVFMLTEVPYDRLFPQMSVIVHHGGAGTTGAAVMAGRPQVVCPFVADQPFWADRMQQLGVAPAPIRQRDLTVSRLAAAIVHAQSVPEIAITAARLGRQVLAEHGTSVAVQALERITRGQPFSGVEAHH